MRNAKGERKIVFDLCDFTCCDALLEYNYCINRGIPVLVGVGIILKCAEGKICPENVESDWFDNCSAFHHAHESGLLLVHGGLAFRHRFYHLCCKYEDD
jgi:hypothetical protein